MPGALVIDQRFRWYTGTPQEIKQAIDEDLAKTDLWFIKDMNVMTSGQGVIAWALWERRVRQ